MSKLLNAFLLSSALLFSNFSNAAITTASIKFDNNHMNIKKQVYLKIFYRIVSNPYSSSPQFGDLQQLKCVSCGTIGETLTPGAQLTLHGLLDPTQVLFVDHAEAYTFMGDYLYTTYYDYNASQPCRTHSGQLDEVVEFRPVENSIDYTVCAIFPYYN